MSLEDMPSPLPPPSTSASTRISSSASPSIGDNRGAEGEEEDEEGDTIFGAATAPDTARIILNEPSLRLLRGSSVDYTDELIGSQFKIVGNPRAKSSCGCGTSFDVEF